MNYFEHASKSTERTTLQIFDLGEKRIKSLSIKSEAFKQIMAAIQEELDLMKETEQLLLNQRLAARHFKESRMLFRAR